MWRRTNDFPSSSMSRRFAAWQGGRPCDRSACVRVVGLLSGRRDATQRRAERRSRRAEGVTRLSARRAPSPAMPDGGGRRALVRVLRTCSPLLHRRASKARPRLGRAQVLTCFYELSPCAPLIGVRRGREGRDGCVGRPRRRCAASLEPAKRSAWATIRSRRPPPRRQPPIQTTKNPSATSVRRGGWMAERRSCVRCRSYALASATGGLRRRPPQNPTSAASERDRGVGRAAPARRGDRHWILDAATQDSCKRPPPALPVAPPAAARRRTRAAGFSASHASAQPADDGGVARPARSCIPAPYGAAMVARAWEKQWAPCRAGAAERPASSAR